MVIFDKTLRSFQTNIPPKVLENQKGSESRQQRGGLAGVNENVMNRQD